MLLSAYLSDNNVLFVYIIGLDFYLYCIFNVYVFFLCLFYVYVFWGFDWF